MINALPYAQFVLLVSALAFAAGWLVVDAVRQELHDRRRHR